MSLCKSYLSHIVDRIILHGLNESECLLVASARTSDTQGHGGPVADVGVVRFGQQLHHTFKGRLKQ